MYVRWLLPPRRAFRRGTTRSRPAFERAPGRELPDLFCFRRRDLCLPEADALSPSPAATPNRAPARGTTPAKAKASLISNINACMAVVDSVRTTLVRPRVASRFAIRTSSHAPRPSDFVFRATTPVRSRRAREAWTNSLHDDKGVTTISNDGATIMKVRDVTRSQRRRDPPPKARNAPIGQQFPTGSRLASFVRAFRPGVVARHETTLSQRRRRRPTRLAHEARRPNARCLSRDAPPSLVAPPTLQLLGHRAPRGEVPDGHRALAGFRGWRGGRGRGDFGAVSS